MEVIKGSDLKLQEMRKSGDISNEYYQIMKNKLIG